MHFFEEIIDGNITLKIRIKIKINRKRKKKGHGKGLKILTFKQMLQEFPIPLAQVKAGNTSENLLNEILQIIYSLYRAKEITDNKIINSIYSYNTVKLYQVIKQK